MNCDFCPVFDPEPPVDPVQNTFPPKISLAMSYVPYQRFEHLYTDEKALERGTLFEALDLPFIGGKRGIFK